jgi:hypothetical protein
MKSLARASKTRRDTSCQLHRVDQGTIWTRDKDIHQCAMCSGSKIVACKRRSTHMKSFGMILNFFLRNPFTVSLTMLEPFLAVSLWLGDNNGRAAEFEDTELTVVSSMKFSIFCTMSLGDNSLVCAKPPYSFFAVVQLSNMNELLRVGLHLRRCHSWSLSNQANQPMAATNCAAAICCFTVTAIQR